MRFSKITQCFYPEEIVYQNLPDDITDVTKADFDLAMSRQDGETLDLVNGAVVIVPISAQTLLAKAKAARISYIEEQYEAREHADIVYLGATFQTGDESQKLIDRVLSAQNGTAPAGFGWYDITNTKVQMTNADLQGLANAIFLRNQPLFDNKQARKAAIRAAATAAEVEAVTW